MKAGCNHVMYTEFITAAKKAVFNVLYRMFVYLSVCVSCRQLHVKNTDHIVMKMLRDN